MRRILYIFCIFIIANSSFAAENVERDYFSKLTYVEWRIFGEVTTESYGEKLDKIEEYMFDRKFPFKSRFTRIRKILNTYFVSDSHIRPIKCLVEKGTVLNFKLGKSIHSYLDDAGYVDITLNKDVYSGNNIVLMKGLHGRLDVLKTQKRKPIMQNGKIRAKIDYLNTWYNYKIYFEEKYSLGNKTNINLLMGGLGYVSAGFRGFVLLFTGINTENVYLKKDQNFNIKVEKDMILWGITG